LYLTEFSLSPEGRKADAPDTDIKKVVQFIQAQAGKTGAQLITPLIRNVCNDEGEWLLYINGRVFTQFGTEVTDNCEGKSGYGYDTSIYPGYDAISDRYYLHPIRGILPAQSIPERKVEYIRADLARQGYEAYCAAPKSEIKLQISLVENMEKFIDLYGGVRLNAISEYDLDLTNVRTPIYRDVDDKRFLMNSMEEYWGFKDHWVGTPTEAELNSAPINSIVTTTQRCIQSVRTLTAVQLMCERLTDPSKCALLPRPIPGTNETVQTLLEKVAVAIPGYREGRISEGCNQMFHSVSPTASYGLSPLQTAILNTPLHLDRSYRLAFMVAAIEYEKFNPPDLFNFFSERDPEVDPRHEVLIAAFKIPDILTNKGGGEESGHQYWDDPAILTRNSLVPEKMRTGVYEPEADARRIATAQQAKNASAQNPGSKIYCVNGGTAEYGYVDGVGSPACKDELGKSVVDIINGNSPSCSDMEDEPVVQIEDSGTLHISDAQLQNNGLLYNPGYGFGETLLRDLFLNNIHQLSQQKTETPQQVISLYDIKRGWNIGRTAEVQFYLLYPIGYELGEVTHVLKQTFLTSEQQIKEEFTDPPADRFAMSGGSFGNRGGTADHTFTDTTDCSLGINPQTGLPGWICEEKDFALNLQEEGGGSLGLTGPQLGYWMRKAQLALTPLYTKAHAYLNSCTTTEQFLLGRCAGGIVATPTGSGGSSSGTGQCGLNYPVKAENLNPPYEQPTPFSSFPGQVPEDPRHGKAMFYGQGLMDQVLANRKAWGQIPQDKIQTCEGSDPVYKGCVALLRAGDIGREIWMQRPGGAIQGPFLVIDVAAKHDVSCLLERGWVVDVDRETAREWNMDGPIDIILHEQR
ncbi:hypothetical protein KBC79_02625, partial [Candidatus Woesebacteria bacterium]|nr:hypothetical protein [Candidatus Woesebacteria bacterium]